MALESSRDANEQKPPPIEATMAEKTDLAITDRPSSPKSEKASSVTKVPEDKTLSGSDTDVAGPAPDAETTEISEQEWITGLPLFMILGSITLVIFLMLLDMTIIAVAIPQITQEFHSIADVGWYGSAYNLASAALQPLSGKLYTHFKTKWTFITFVLLFLIGSLLCGVAQSSKMLIVGRAIAGMGTSGIQNGGITIISESVPLHKRPQLIGIMIGVGQIGIVIGPLVGGAITQYSTWRWCFYLNLPVGAVALLILLLINIPDKSSLSRQTTRLNNLPTIIHKLDLVGSAIFAPAAIMFLMAIEFGGRDHPWNSATVIGLFVGSGVTFLLFIGWEWREGENAMIPLAMVAKREVWTSAVVGMMSMAGLTLVPGYFLPIFFQSVGGQTPLMSGVYTLASILSSLVMAVVSGVLVGRLGYCIPWVVYSAVVSGVGCGLVTTFTPDTSHAKWIGYLIIIGIGRGASLQMALLAVQAILPQDQIPVSMAFLIFAQTFAGSIFLTIGNTIFASSLNTKLVEYVPDIDLPKVLAAGANGFRAVVTESQLPGVLLAYAESLALIFYLPVAAAILMFGFAWGMGWNDVREKKKIGVVTTEKGGDVSGGVVDVV